jgi:2-dehydropantoate 2-reductase
MKFAVAGAGAIGAYVGAKMAQAGADVSLFARGRHGQAMRERGVRIVSAEGEFVARPRVVESLQQAGPVDVVLLAVKAHSLPALAPELPALFGPETTVVSMQNGLPWWYFQGAERLERVDPGGVISAAIEARRVAGAIVYLSTEIIEPGVIRHIEGNRITIGEPDGARSERCRAISQALAHAGLRAPITTHLRQEIWVKLLGNVAFNPISALTGATLAAMARDPEVNQLVRSVMAETEAVARKLGIEMPITIDQRIAGAEKVGEHKTSMLQDLEAGRPLELDAVVGAVLELGERLGIAMPHTRAVYACAKLLERQRRGAN